jgi:hypothetical protein
MNKLGHWEVSPPDIDDTAQRHVVVARLRCSRLWDFPYMSCSTFQSILIVTYIHSQQACHQLKQIHQVLPVPALIQVSAQSPSHPSWLGATKAIDPPPFNSQSELEKAESLHKPDGDGNDNKMYLCSVEKDEMRKFASEDPDRISLTHTPRGQGVAGGEKIATLWKRILFS